VGDYASAAAFYDLLYGATKDYVREADVLRTKILEAHPSAVSVLDVACGTGSHARALTDRGFRVDGVDLEPAFIEVARGRCPEGRFSVADMTLLDLPGRYDVATCLFSAIGYARTEEALRSTIARMAAHLKPGGVVVVDPWFEPGQVTDGRVSTLLGEGDGVTAFRMSRTVLEGTVSRLDLEYLIGTSAGLERRSEVHRLGLFTQQQMEAAFVAAGLSVTRHPEVLRTRGLYVGRAE
jgi:SAM-dependent methyltransferase